jgi:hypothetical protein
MSHRVIFLVEDPIGQQLQTPELKDQGPAYFSFIRDDVLEDGNRCEGSG